MQNKKNNTARSEKVSNNQNSKDSNVKVRHTNNQKAININNRIDQTLSMLSKISEKNKLAVDNINQIAKREGLATNTFEHTYEHIKSEEYKKQYDKIKEYRTEIKNLENEYSKLITRKINKNIGERKGFYEIQKNVDDRIMLYLVEEAERGNIFFRYQDSNLPLRKGQKSWNAGYTKEEVLNTEDEFLNPMKVEKGKSSFDNPITLIDRYNDWNELVVAFYGDYIDEGADGEDIASYTKKAATFEANDFEKYFQNIADDLLKDNIKNPTLYDIEENINKRINSQNVKDNGIRAERASGIRSKKINANKITLDTQYNGLEYDNQPLYFRFDEIDGFRGKEHQSGISMWEEQVDDLLTPDVESSEYFDAAIRRIDDILNQYDTTYEEYNNMSDKDKMKIKREIALDEGLITRGASVFDLSEDGLEFFINYDRSHHETDYPVVNIFTGKENGYGADGETVVIPDIIVATMNTKDFEVLFDNNIENLNDIKPNELIKILKNIQKKLQSSQNTEDDGIRAEKISSTRRENMNNTTSQPYDARKYEKNADFVNYLKDNNYLKVLMEVDNEQGSTYAQSFERRMLNFNIRCI